MNPIPTPPPDLASVGPGDTIRALLVCVMLTAGIQFATPAETPETFASKEAAVTALTRAVESEDPVAIKSIFGPDVVQITSPDPVQARNDYARFAASLKEAHRVVDDSEDRAVLETGAEQIPFPVPLVKKDGRWYFDTAAGVEEIINRRIGRNELDALASMRAYVDAQREYAGRDHDGDEVLEYAQKLVSSPGEQNGLFWPPGADGELSPLGPYLAFAQEAGYEFSTDGPDAEPQPFRGYYFRILTKQTKAAPGGKYNYIINGNMIGGFALVAWPAVYDETGIMTFIVNQQGRVYQKDLGSGTEKDVKKMKEYDPDSSWVVSPD